MSQNPYKYIGPLNPVNDGLVCIPRTKDIDRVIKGIINKGDYWAILGPRQIGKTTFLRMIQHQFPHASYLYFNFEVPPSNEKNLYRLMIDELKNEILSDQAEIAGDENQDENPSFKFLEFLKTFTPGDDTKMIVFLFDEIDGLPYLRNFLHVWRNLFIESYHKEKLKKYRVIITGSVDLIGKTTGPNSPFNIAKTFYIKDFLTEESAMLIENPMNRLNITIEPGAQEYLLSQVSGHPQLLQHLCHILVETAMNKEKSLTVTEVNKAIEELFKSNSTLNILEKHLEEDRELTILVKEILKGEKRVYYPFKNFSFSGVGPIIDVDNSCSLRNKIFERFLKHLPGISEDDSSKKSVNKNACNSQKKTPTVFISYSHKDKEWKDILLTHLGVLEINGVFRTWNDQKTPPGEKWRQTIKKNINTASISVFLISAHSLTSEFILNEEKPLMLKRYEKGMTIFPVLVKDCAWKDVEWLSEMQIWPEDAIPIEKCPAWKQNEIFKEITLEIARLLNVGKEEDKHN